MYIIDLPAGADGRRRQLKRKAFPSQAAALAAEADSRAAYGGVRCQQIIGDLADELVVFQPNRLWPSRRQNSSMGVKLPNGFAGSARR